MTLNVAEHAFTDAAGSLNAVSAPLVIQRLPPPVPLLSVPGVTPHDGEYSTVLDHVTLKIECSLGIVGLELVNITVSSTGATISDLQQAPLIPTYRGAITAYLVTVSFGSSRSMTVSLPAGAFSDATGYASTEASVVIHNRYQLDDSVTLTIVDAAGALIPSSAGKITASTVSAYLNVASGSLASPLQLTDVTVTSPIVLSDLVRSSSRAARMKMTTPAASVANNELGPFSASVPAGALQVVGAVTRMSGATGVGASIGTVTGASVGSIGNIPGALNLTGGTAGVNAGTGTISWSNLTGPWHNGQQGTVIPATTAVSITMEYTWTYSIYTRKFTVHTPELSTLYIVSGGSGFAVGDVLEATNDYNQTVSLTVEKISTELGISGTTPTQASNIVTWYTSPDTSITAAITSTVVSNGGITGHTHIPLSISVYPPNVPFAVTQLHGSANVVFVGFTDNGNGQYSATAEAHITYETSIVALTGGGYDGTLAPRWSDDIVTTPWWGSQQRAQDAGAQFWNTPTRTLESSWGGPFFVYAGSYDGYFNAWNPGQPYGGGSRWFPGQRVSVAGNYVAYTYAIDGRVGEEWKNMTEYTASILANVLVADGDDNADAINFSWITSTVVPVPILTVPGADLYNGEYFTKAGSVTIQVDCSLGIVGLDISGIDVEAGATGGVSSPHYLDGAPVYHGVKTEKFFVVSLGVAETMKLTVAEHAFR